MTLGERIAYYRGKLGLSQGELAEQLGVSRQARKQMGDRCRTAGFGAADRAFPAVPYHTG